MSPKISVIDTLQDIYSKPGAVAKIFHTHKKNKLTNNPCLLHSSVDKEAAEKLESVSV